MNQRLREVVTRTPDYWSLQDDQKPNKFPAFKETTQHVVLSFPVSISSAREACFYPAWEDWKDVIQPVIDLVTGYYGYEDGQVNRIMLANLLAGCEIPLHIDRDPSSALPHKVHVPMITNPGVEFWEADRRYHLEVGVAWEVNNRIMHGGANYGDQDRVHLIFDYFDRKQLPPPDLITLRTDRDR